MNISTQIEKTTQFDSEWNGEKFGFTAKANMLTPKVLQQFQEFQTQPVLLAHSLADILTDWTIDFNGEPFPPTAENLERVPVDFLVHIIEKIGETWVGNGQRPRPSANGSAASAQ